MARDKKTQLEKMFRFLFLINIQGFEIDNTESVLQSFRISYEHFGVNLEFIPTTDSKEAKVAKAQQEPHCP